MKQRQFKFRVWSFGKNEWLHPTYFGIRADGTYDELMNNGDHFMHCYNRDGWVIQQFTGLYDKDGKEIYEGDVIYVKDFCNYLIYWDEDLKGFNFRQVEFQELYNIDISDGWPIANSMEIIGNIMEHPELLK